MQWLLQDFEDTRKLGDALTSLGRDVSWHKIIPFVGDLTPQPMIKDPKAVVLFGAYSMWKYAETDQLEPGVFRIAPFLEQSVWHPYLLNGTDAHVMSFGECASCFSGDSKMWFLRPVEDSKEVPGRVMAAQDIADLSARVSALPEGELPIGSLRADTLVMLTEPQAIDEEWRLWVVEDRVVTYSRYKQAGQVGYVHDIPEDALRFGQEMAQLNSGYAPAYVIDICRAKAGLRIIETNGINAAGFYAAELEPLIHAIERLCEA
ncbi:ATP-grasp domain-containing protein [Shimia sp. MIT910701]|uniref:ATP-grasp domain-containing protein n=2 Tax=unclassified Shimia TaxID=2630038 RepID=UPI00399B583B|nr:ATP-grasp domain-containing protein [Shimia sp.]